MLQLQSGFFNIVCFVSVHIVAARSWIVCLNNLLGPFQQEIVQYTQLTILLHSSIVEVNLFMLDPEVLRIGCLLLAG